MTDWNGAPVFGTVPDSVQPIDRPSAYCVLLDQQGRQAVVRTPLGLYLPGGGMESGESVIETVVREAWEECGLESSVGGWIARATQFVYSPSDRCHYRKLSTFVDARCSDIRGEGVEPDHALEWMTPHDSADQLVDASHRWAVREWLTSHRAQTSPTPTANRC